MLSAALRPIKGRTSYCILTSLNDFLNSPPLGFSTFRRNVWAEAPQNNLNDSFYDLTVEEYAKRPISKLTLQHMLEAGRDAWFDNTKILESARFTSEELPKRLARRLLDLQLLPYIVVNNPHISQVYQSYRHAFDILRDYPPPQTMSENDKFSTLLRRLVDEHAPMLDALANGLREIKRKPLVGPHVQLDSFLEAMLSSRISRRVLAEHHINLNNSRPGYIGVICTDLSLADSIDFAAGRSKQVCIETYGAAPEILVSGDIRLKVPYIPAHLDYMLYELLKNASRAVVERHLALRKKRKFSSSTSSSTDNVYPSTTDTLSSNRDIRFPPIHVRICGGGTDDVTLRISDQGGGIPVHLLEKVWEFGWTDVDNNNDNSTLGVEQQEEIMNMTSVNSTNSTNTNSTNISSTNSTNISSTNSEYIDELMNSEGLLRREGLGLDSSTPSSTATNCSTTVPGFDFNPTPTAASGRFRMAGLGFGLPLSRLYARYFGGDLRILSLPGYGVDAYLYLKGLGGVSTGSGVLSGKRDWAEQQGSSGSSGGSGGDGGSGADGVDGATGPRDEEGIGALGVSPTGVNIY